MLATIACASATSGNAGLTRTPLSSTPRGACGPIAGAPEKGVLGELEWRPSLSRSRVTADALDHGAHAVRALWRKMLPEAQPAKSALGVDGRICSGVRSENTAIAIAINPRTMCKSLSPR